MMSESSHWVGVMSFIFCALRRCSLIGFAALFLTGSTVSAIAQAPSCPAVPAHDPSPAETAYTNADFGSAESLYMQALAQHPQDAGLSAALVNVLLQEGKLSQAETQANSLVDANPNSASALTAMAEVELRDGQPGPAGSRIDKAIAANPCYAFAHLVRSRILRIESMYTSERAEIQRAYDINPTNPDIQQAWQGIVSPAQEIQSVDDSLKSMSGIDADSRKKAEASIHDLMPLLHEHSQTCQGLPTDSSAELTLEPSMLAPRQIEGYKLEVQLPQSKLKLLVDTAASGLYISKAVADQNGFKQGPNDPPGTVHVDSLRVGALEFRNCIVGVSNTPFTGNSDGFVGTDIFSPWMVTLDFRLQKLTLSPLPKQTEVLPGDRPNVAELANFTPVYRRRQYFLAPVTFKDNSQKLFILATGMRNSAMTSDAAHSVSKMKVDFTNTEQTTSGGKVQFFREVFDMQLPNQPQIHQGHIIEFDPTVVDQNAGFKIAGMMGLDILRQFTLHLDYRDGLVDFEPINGEGRPSSKGETLTAANQNSPECQLADPGDHPLDTTIEATVITTLDSAQLKPGKKIWLKSAHEWVSKECRIDQDANVYGQVVASTSTKNPNSSELAIMFDHADCTGHSGQPLTLRLIAIAAPPDESGHSHDALPTEVAGGGRSISNAAASTGVFIFDDNLNPGGPPHTIHPGVVIRMPQIELEPVGGPGCSARIRSTQRSVRLGTGAELIFTAEGKAPEEQ